MLSLNMDEISFRALSPADAAEAACVIKAAFAAQPRSTEPPSSALKETSAAVAAEITAGGGIGAFGSGALVAAVLWEIKGARCTSGACPSFRPGGAAVSPGPWLRPAKARRDAGALCG